MKRILLVLLSCTLGLIAYAAPISQQEALRLAKQYLHQSRTALGQQSQQSELVLAYECKSKTTRGTNSDEVLYYVFNHGIANGFIVVAGDDRMQRPVLAHTEQGTFNQSDINPALQWWFEAVKHTMAHLMSQPEPQNPTAKIATPGKFAQAVAPLVTAKWNQGAPYNDTCPIDNGQRSLVGCVAVAMGQILHKWKSPIKPNGEIISYVTETKKIPVEADMRTFTFDWDNMLDTYDNNASPEQRKAVADLLYACGLAIHMDYTNSGSGASVSPSQLKNYFNIDKNCSSIRRIYFSTSEWDAILKTELNAGRPMIYGASAADPNSGHAFVCDGYNSQGLYHINWGWGGHADGYYEISALNNTQSAPGDPNGFEGGYNYHQDIVYGIQPAELENASPVDTEQRLYFNDIQVKNKTYNKWTYLRINLTDVASDGNAFNGTMGIGYHDGKNYRFLYQEDLELDDSGNYYPDFTVDVNLAPLADGNYQLIPICQVKGGPIKPMQFKRSGNIRTVIPIQVKGDEYKVIDNSKDYMIKLEVPNVELVSDTAFAGINCVWNVSVKNPSSFTFMGPILVALKTNVEEYTVCAQNSFVIEAGETKVIPFKFKSPVGVDSTTFAVLGEKYEVLKEHTYALQQPITGTPKFTAENTLLDLGEKVFYAGDSLTLTMTLQNEGGIYDNSIEFLIYKYPYTEPFQVLRSFKSKHMIINGNTSKTFTASVDLNGLPAGAYYLAPLYNTTDYSTEWLYTYVNTQPVFSIAEIAKTGEFVRVKSADNENYLTLTSPSASGFTPATLSTADDNSLFYYDHQQLLSYSHGYYLNQQDDQAGATGIQSKGTKFQLSQQEPAQENVFHLLLDNGQYLSADAKAVEKSAAGKFIMEKVSSLPLTIPATGYASLYAPVALEIPTGVEAFVGTCAGQHFLLSPVDQVIPANTAVILTAKEGTYELPITVQSDKEYNNDLQGVIATQDIPDALILQHKETAGLYSAPTSTLSGFQAYLSKEKAHGATALPFQKGDPTGIESLKQAKKPEVFYDMNGRLVLYPTHGVYVTGEGKKIFVK